MHRAPIKSLIRTRTIEFKQGKSLLAHWASGLSNNPGKVPVSRDGPIYFEDQPLQHVHKIQDNSYRTGHRGSNATPTWRLPLEFWALDWFVFTNGNKMYTNPTGTPGSTNQNNTGSGKCKGLLYRLSAHCNARTKGHNTVMLAWEAPEYWDIYNGWPSARVGIE